MGGYEFTTTSRDALLAARDCAIELRHEYVGTEHLLLGLLRGEGSTAMAALDHVGVKGAEVRKMILELVMVGRGSDAAGSELPYTSRSKKVLDLAMIASRESGQPAVDAEHLLLGLLRETRGIAAQVLTRLGVGSDELVAAIDRIRGSDGRPEPIGHSDVAASRTVTVAAPAGTSPIAHALVARSRPSLVGVVIAVGVALTALWILFR
ncbi:MAG: hypothetical protein H0W15_04955 [Gemmatimonadales bacterium]|nr:hypothetical protein [Gemmatimonadales bacterium]